MGHEILNLPDILKTRSLQDYFFPVPAVAALCELTTPAFNVT
jgi:hypothetical protein